MKSLEWVKENLNKVEQDEFLDKRFTSRFLDFLPCEEWEKYGFEANEECDLSNYKPKEWTEENILNQLKSDLEFGIEKAENHRGISASLMFDVVKSWCLVLENGLENTEYGWYGDKLFKAVDEYYGWGLVKGHFDEEFYREW